MNRQRIIRNYAGMKGTFHFPFIQLLGVGLAGLFLTCSFFYATGLNLSLSFLAIAAVAISQGVFLKSAYQAYGLRFAFAAFFLRNLEIRVGEAAIVVALIAIFSKIRKNKLCLFI